MFVSFPVSNEMYLSRLWGPTLKYLFKHVLDNFMLFWFFPTAEVDTVPDDVHFFFCPEWDKYVATASTLSQISVQRPLGEVDVLLLLSATKISITESDAFLFFGSRHEYRRAVSAFSQMSVQEKQNKSMCFWIYLRPKSIPSQEMFVPSWIPGINIVALRGLFLINHRGRCLRYLF